MRGGYGAKAAGRLSVFWVSRNPAPRDEQVWRTCERGERPGLEQGAGLILHTPRLILRPQEQADAQALFPILNDPQAMRFWHRPAIARLAVVEEIVCEQQAAMASGLCRYWTLVEAGRVIGSADLSLIADGSAELGFLVRRDRWGLGLASEAVAAVIAHAFDTIGLSRLAAATYVDNRAAARVLEKNGFARRDRRLVFLAGGALVDCAFYARDRA